MFLPTPSTLRFHNPLILLGTARVIQIRSMVPLQAGIPPEDFTVILYQELQGTVKIIAKYH